MNYNNMSKISNKTALDYLIKLTKIKQSARSVVKDGGLYHIFNKNKDLVLTLSEKPYSIYQNL